MANLMEVIADPMRREILRHVWTEEKSVGTLVDLFDVTQPAISFHLRMLRDHDLVTSRKNGTHRYYKALPKNFGALRVYLESYWADQLSRLKDQAELEARKERRRGKQRI